MKPKTGARFALAGVSLALCVAAHADEGKVDYSGSIRLYGDRRADSSAGPLAQARKLSTGIAAPAEWTAELDATLKGTWRSLSGAVTFRDTESPVAGNRRRLVLDELATTNDWGGSLHSTVGKKVVSWDVGYAFRPNDLVQQEARRTLVPTTLEGRPLAMLEGFSAESAWSVLAFRQDARSQDQHPSALPENVLAGRFYAQIKGADTYLFGRWGSESGSGAGAAFSVVATDEIELHGSVARTGRFQAPMLSPGVPVLASSYPYELVTRRGAAQVLLGMTWTNESKVSVIAEAWYDGTAPANGFWDSWNQRSAAIAAVVHPASPPAMVDAAAGNMGWQANQLQAGSLRRRNVFVRMSWTLEEWQPGIDLLFTPEDRGYVVTAGLAWQGDRIRVELGGRTFGGPDSSLYGQTPVKSIGYVGVTLPF